MAYIRPVESVKIPKFGDGPFLQQYCGKGQMVQPNDGAMKCGAVSSGATHKWYKESMVQMIVVQWPGGHRTGGAVNRWWSSRWGSCYGAIVDGSVVRCSVNREPVARVGHIGLYRVNVGLILSRVWS